MNTIIESITIMDTSSGKTIAYTFSEVDDDGLKKSSGERRTFIVMNDETLEYIEMLKTNVLEKHKKLR